MINILTANARIYTLKKYLEVNRNSIYTYYKNSGQWIRIPLLIKKVVSNGFECH